jgi:hypothetical protein
VDELNAGDRGVLWLEGRSEFLCLLAAYGALAAVLGVEHRICGQYSVADLDGSLPQQFAVGMDLLFGCLSFLLLGFLANLACSVICVRRAGSWRAASAIFGTLWATWSFLAAWIFLSYRPFLR